MKYNTLYKRTSTGATQTWYMERVFQAYRTISGQLGGKQTVSAWRDALPKNVGKSNETTGTQQAEAEVASQYKKKLEKDYHESVEDIDVSKMFKAMTAQKYQDRKDKITFPVYVQPKLDGMRCIATPKGLFTRGGKPIYNCQHIHDEVCEVMGPRGDWILDGELYNHEYKDDFNSIISAAKHQHQTPEYARQARNTLQYHVYDLPSAAGTFFYRGSQLRSIIGRSIYIKLVTTHIANSKEEVDNHLGEFLEQGYEGAIVRTDDTPYENKRSNSLLKYKQFQDEEFIVVDIEEGQGNWAGYAKRATLRLKDGRTFGAGIAGTQDYTKLLLDAKDEFIGKPCTVRFFCLTPDGIPRFGIAKEFDRSDNL